MNERHQAMYDEALDQVLAGAKKLMTQSHCQTHDPSPFLELAYRIWEKTKSQEAWSRAMGLHRSTEPK